MSCNHTPWSKKLLASCLGGRYISRQLIDDTNKAVGFYIVDKVIDEMTIMEICVAPSLQGQGLGQTLLNDLFLQAKSHQVVTIHLEVRESNLGAIALYQKNGFVETYRRNGYYPGEHGPEDAIMMLKELG